MGFTRSRCCSMILCYYCFMFDLKVPDAAYAFGLLQADGTHAGNLDGKGRIALELAV